MIDAQQLAAAYTRNTRILTMECDGLTHEESLLQTPFRANCLNWVLGHIAYSRAIVLEVLGVTDAASSDSLARYATEGDPVAGDGLDVLRLEDLLTLLDQQGTAIATALTSATSEALTPAQATGIFGRYFHETWHAGQTELLRQLAGRNDKVI